MFQKILPLLCLLLVMTVLPAAAAVPPPLPNDINIVAPGPEVPEKLASLSGKWAGQFSWTGLNGGASGSRELVLVVEKIEGDQVSVIFSFGSDPRSKEKWTRVVGTFSSLGKLKIPLIPPFSRADVTEEFTLKPDGTLAFWAPPSSPYGSDFNGILKKQP
jgi:hypothetical protein